MLLTSLMLCCFCSSLGSLFRRKLLKLFSNGFSLLFVGLFDELELILLLELLCLPPESMDCGAFSIGSTKAEGRLALEGIDLAGFLHLEEGNVFFNNGFANNWDHPFITTVKGLGGVRKIVFFVNVQYYSLMLTIGGSEKVQKCADVFIAMVPN